MTYNEAQTLYLKNISTTEKKDLIRYRHRRFIQGYIGKKDLRHIRRSDIQDVANRVMNTKVRVKGKLVKPHRYYKKSYAQKIVTQIKTIIENAITELDMNIVNPVHKIKYIHPKKSETLKDKPPVVNAIHRFKEVVNCIEETFKDDPIVRAALLFLAAGRRKKEILSLTWDDVSLASKTYRARIHKNEEYKTFAMIEPIYNALLQIENKQGYIFERVNKFGERKFVSIDWYVKKLRLKCGFAYLTPHYFRNLLVSAMYAKGADSNQLSAMLGHNNRMSINTYLTLDHNSGIDRAKDTLNELGL